ncbi:Metallo-dependent phosphatase-like protein [Pisolithus marmoratus]|nr:Metallo-dependent phosphatase-like protein [Pisolithus marmoratus]
MLLIWLVLGLCLPATSLPTQVVLDAPQLPSLHTGDRRLQGRFLHITDLHPDPFYKRGAHPSTACHRTKPKKKRRAGYYGTAYKECDSPFALTNFTLDYLEKRWSDDIDFVIWTGDSARHDNDDKIPRPLSEVYELNRAVTEKMKQVFSSKGIPVVPTIGNNDVWRPNDITRTYSSMWDGFIPSDSRASFLQGGYFSIEVVPGALAVVSLNTMYFYSSNEGHVPPMDGHYYSRCYGRYVELSLRFQDTILGHLFGHLNTDHFYFMKADDVHVDENAKETLKLTRHAASLFDMLVADFSRLPGPQDGIEYGDYAVVNVNPSVVPNPYVPTFRAYVYNVTGLPDGMSERYGGVGFEGSPECWGKSGSGAVKRKGGYRRDELEGCGVDFGGGVHFGSPSRRNLLWTPLGYAQYWMPKVEEYDARDTPEYELEYLTFSLSRLHAGGAGGQISNTQPFIPLENLPEELRDAKVEKSKYAPYDMDDLTIPSWIELARRIGKDRGKLRRRFRKYLYVGGEDEP